MSISKQLIFERDLSLYWHCESGRSKRMIDALKRALESEQHQISGSEFRSMLANAISNNIYSIEKYEELTGIDFETTAEVANDLRNLWQQLFGGTISP